MKLTDLAQMEFEKDIQPSLIFNWDQQVKQKEGQPER